MELLVHLNTNDAIAPNNRIHEARNIIARLQSQNITHYKLLPNSNNPTAIQFTYNGRNTAGIQGESARKQYNDINSRDSGTFVSMQQILTTDLMKHGQYNKKGQLYAKIPIHLRTRAQLGQPAHNTGSTLVRTIHNSNEAGKWLVLLQNRQLNQHSINNNPIPNQPTFTPEDIRHKLNIKEPIDIMNDLNNISPIELQSKDRLNNFNSVTPNNIKFNSTPDDRDDY